MLATANTKKSGGVLENADEWTRRVQIRKKSLAVSVACMAIYCPTLGFKGKMFKLCVLTRWDFNFCVRSSPLQGVKRGMKTELDTGTGRTRHRQI